MRSWRRQARPYLALGRWFVKSPLSPTEGPRGPSKGEQSDSQFQALRALLGRASTTFRGFGDHFVSIEWLLLFGNAIPMADGCTDGQTLAAQDRHSWLPWPSLNHEHSALHGTHILFGRHVMSSKRRGGARSGRGGEAPANVSLLPPASAAASRGFFYDGHAASALSHLLWTLQRGPPQQLRQPRDIGGDPPRLVSSENFGLSGLCLRCAGIDIRQGLAIGVPHDITARYLVSMPGGRETAGGFTHSGCRASSAGSDC